MGLGPLSIAHRVLAPPVVGLTGELWTRRATRTGSLPHPSDRTAPSAPRRWSTFPYFATPRIAAGAPSSNDVLQCRLKELRRNSPDYGSATFIDEQWERLGAVFPDGVCDWKHRGWKHRATDHVRSVPWLTYANGPGGEPLGKPPASEVVDSKRAR